MASFFSRFATQKKAKPKFKPENKSLCQSCGMPLAKDPNGGGTWTDGKKSKKYCSFCYQRGQFTLPNFTAKDMQKFVMGKMQEMKIPKFLAWILTRNIPYLERWRKPKK